MQIKQIVGNECLPAATGSTCESLVAYYTFMLITFCTFSFFDVDPVEVWSLLQTGKG